jgi:release factor glutamine methyltransferase
LPYIPHEDLPGLTVEIYHYEPRVALDGGDGGLVIYEEFVKILPKYLKPKGMVFCEIGKDQGNLFTKIVQKYLPNTKCNILQDLAGFDRIAVIKRGAK